MKRTPLKRLSELRRTGRIKPKRPPAGEASGISTDHRLAVSVRARGKCERCGRSVLNYPSNVHHRLPRGRGGTDRLSNLALLCGHATQPGGCHQSVESDRTQAYDDGWLIHTGRDPQSIACLTPDGWLYLDDEGGQVTDQTRRSMP